MLILALALQLTTNCNSYGNSTTCQTTGVAPPAPVYQPAPQADYSGFAALGQSIRAKKARSRQKKIGKMIAAGQCEEAQKYALENGEFDLASYARRMCTPQQP